MPEVFDVCFDLPVGQLSSVVPSPYGFHVFKVLERRPARRRPFDEVKGEIARALLLDARAKAQDDFVAALRAKGVDKREAWDEHAALWNQAHA